MATSRTSARTFGVALRAMLLFTVLLGVLYPAVVLGIGQLALPGQANGSLVRVDGRVIGSSLIAQSFSDAKGDALPQWFQPRPSAAGKGWDATQSGGSNLGPESMDLADAIAARREAIAKADGVPADRVPADAVTASGSGLDPHISEAYALEQVDRVASARGLSADRVRALVEQHVQGPDLGFLGETTVNVLQLNVALAALR